MTALTVILDHLGKRIPYLFDQPAGCGAGFAEHRLDSHVGVTNANAYAKGKRSIHFYPLGGFRGLDGHEQCMVLQRDSTRAHDVNRLLDLPEQFDPKAGAKVSRDHTDRGDQPVLVLDVQLVDHPEQVVLRPLWTLPRLSLLDECPYDGVLDPADLVEASGLIALGEEESLLGQEDRELTASRRLVAGAGIYSVIQRGSKIVNAVTHEESPTGSIGWNPPVGVEPKLGSLVILVSGHAVAALLSPPAHLMLETPEVFFSSPDLGKSTVEVVRHAGILARECPAMSRGE